MKVAFMIEKLTVSVLVNNISSGSEFHSEHGLSFLLDTGNEKIVFDTGKTDISVRNAGGMGLSLRETGKIVLSHGHYDHCNGISEMLHETGCAEIFCHPAVFKGKYSRRKGNVEYAGIWFDKEELEKQGADFCFSQDSQRVSDGVFTTGEVPRVMPIETISDRFLVKNTDGEYIPDTFPDDLSLFVKTSKGLVVILGCAHSGVINILKHVCALSGSDKIYAVIGGMHLGAASEERIRMTADFLEELQVQVIGANHCTGETAAALFRERFGDKCIAMDAGMNVVL